MHRIKILFLLFVSGFVFSQTPINTDRPDQSDGVYVLPKNKMQIENGFTFAEKTALNNFMFRYGLSGSTEIRALLDFGMQNSEKGLLPATFSIKQRIVSQKGIFPAITFSGYVSSGYLASKAFHNHEFTFSFITAFENKITDSFAVSYNIGTSSFHKDILFTACFNYAFSEKLTGFAEYFSNFEKTLKPNHNTDFGLLYLMNSNFQIDLATGISIAEQPNLFVTTGISFRL
ncbi:MAG: transporter [Flavobacteriaceae bacterium]|jgi:hypothetical protein|nr:transporter [Flavobacteriaceae bacterium]